MTIGDNGFRFTGLGGDYFAPQTVDRLPLDTQLPCAVYAHVVLDTIGVDVRFIDRYVRVAG